MPEPRDVSVIAPSLGVGVTDVLKAAERNPAILEFVLKFLGDKVLGPLAEKLLDRLFPDRTATVKDDDDVLVIPPADGGRPVDDPVPVKEPRRIAGIRGHYMGAQRKVMPYQKGGGRFGISKEEFRAIISRAQGAQAGDRFAANITPFDQFGKDFLPGESANELLLLEDGTPGFLYEVSGKLEVTNEYDDYGCTPQLLVPWEDPEVRPGFRGEGNFVVSLFVDASGKAVRPGEPHERAFRVQFPTILVTPWGHPSLK